jgi:mRNA interferase MazF
VAGPSRGEIWNADLDPTRGREQAGRRPVLIVSTDRFNEGPAELAVIVPITSKDKRIPWHVALHPGTGTGLRVQSFAMVEAIRCISRERLAKRLGVATNPNMEEVETRLRILLEL